MKNRRRSQQLNNITENKNNQLQDVMHRTSKEQPKKWGMNLKIHEQETRELGA